MLRRYIVRSDQCSARDHVFSDSPCFFSRSEFTVLVVRLHSRPISHLPGATAETFAFHCAAPSTTRDHALHFLPRKTEFLLLLGNKENQRAGTIVHRCILNTFSLPHCHSLEIQLCIKLLLSLAKVGESCFHLIAL